MGSLSLSIRQENMRNEECTQEILPVICVTMRFHPYNEREISKWNTYDLYSDSLLSLTNDIYNTKSNMKINNYISWSNLFFFMLVSNGGDVGGRLNVETSRQSSFSSKYSLSSSIWIGNTLFLCLNYQNRFLQKKIVSEKSILET